jgi:hypothetical protein
MAWIETNLIHETSMLQAALKCMFSTIFFT